MRFKTVMRSTVAIGLASWTAACAPLPVQYAGPGCLIYLYPLPGLQGPPLPVRSDTSDLAVEWHEAAASAKVVYGTWRLFTSPVFTGFMGDYKAPADVVQFKPATKLGSLRCTQLEPAPPPPRY
jgi:hypothetical protein